MSCSRNKVHECGEDERESEERDNDAEGVFDGFVVDALHSPHNELEGTTAARRSGDVHCSDFRPFT